MTKTIEIKLSNATMRKVETHAKQKEITVETAIRIMVERHLNKIYSMRKMAKEAKANGIHYGRKPRLSQKDIEVSKRMRSSGKSVDDIAKKFGVNKSTIYKVLSEST
jgi:DNA invertase Pin-like site-specific DNA recombinase